MPVGKLYTTDASAPTTAVALLEKALGIEIEHIEVNLMNGDHFKPEYFKLNQQHTAPMYVDQNGTVVSDSHAILTYLVGKYAARKTDVAAALYPHNLAQRALIDQRLHFDSGNVYAVLRSIVFSACREGKAPTAKQLEGVRQAYEAVDAFLDGVPWIAGERLSIADFSLISSITALRCVLPIDERHANLLQWIARCEAWPYYEVNADGARRFGEWLQSMTKID